MNAQIPFLVKELWPDEIEEARKRELISLRLGTLEDDVSAHSDDFAALGNAIGEVAVGRLNIAVLRERLGGRINDNQSVYVWLAELFDAVSTGYAQEQRTLQKLAECQSRIAKLEKRLNV